MEIREILKKEVAQGNISHAYLFVGDGSKTADAISAISQSLETQQSDVVAIEPLVQDGKKGEIKAEEVREFLRQLHLTPHGPYRLGIIKQIERLNLSSANTLLKTLEEPPLRTIIILTAETESILPTIKSRCRIYKLGYTRVIGPEAIIYEDFFNQDLASNFKKIEEIVKEDRVVNFLNTLELWLEKKLCAEKTINVAEKIKFLQEIRKRIDKNANAKLALECLILKIKE